jgi:aspartyl-tRNA(Asn)/glutamyl-tRNA(Gln) amidotransferase subunit A
MAIENLLSGRLSGHPLALAARALRQPRIAALGADVLRRELGVTELPDLIEGNERLEPAASPRPGRPPRQLPETLESPQAPSWAPTCEALTAAYSSGRTTPERVLEHVFSEADRLAQRQPLLSCLWTRDELGAREAARASSQRYDRGRPKGPLDGVPVLLKEELAVRGLPRRLGHELPSPAPMQHDATVVARLREAGAIVVGQTAMTELGMSPIGVNPNRPALRNPHHVERAAGGSSTGAGIAAAVGLTPISVGADGGGSIRIPAAICGVFGLKPSFGRVSRKGDAFSGSMNHLGPLGPSTRDLAVFLDAVSGADPGDPLSLGAPPVTGRFESATRRDVRGLRIGVDAREWRDADPAVAAACEHALKALQEAGAVLVDVTIPLAASALAIGALTIAAETHACAAHSFERHRDAFGLDVQAFMHIVGQLSAREFLWCQTLRERLRTQVARSFGDVDALAMPTTARTGLPIGSSDDRTGRLDAQGVKAMCRYAFLANLTGLPAGTVPVGLDPDGLPMGLQIVGDAWDEGTVLSLMASLERSGAGRVLRPPHHVELLG